jgi:N-acetylneuraminic acid mutarotase
MPDQTCSQCGETFSSRNKLFKHIATIHHESEGSIKCSRSVDDVLKTEKGDVYLYVIGGRYRGKTLGCSERYSLRKGIWETDTSMSCNRGSHGCVACKDSIYAIGGGGIESNVSSCEKFDIKTDKWTNIPSMEICCHALTIFSNPSGNNIYAIGGWVNGSICSNNCEKFDIETNTWQTLQSMNISRRLAGADMTETDIYVFGGLCSDGNHLSTDIKTNGWFTRSAEKYNIKNGNWTNIANLPFNGQASACSIGNDIYVFIHGKAVYRYDPIEDSYLNISELPEEQWFGFDVTKFGNKIFLAGGTIKGSWSTVIYVYDTSICKFISLPPMRVPRRRLAIAAIEIRGC